MFLFAVMTGGLTLLPTVANASTFVEELVNDTGTQIFWDNSEGNTRALFRITDTKGMWLKLNESTWNSDEDFHIVIQSNSFLLPDITKVYVQIFKLDNNFGNYRPSESEWVTSSASAGGGSRPGDSVTIIKNTDNSYRFSVDLNPAFGNFSEQLNIDLFGSSRSENLPWLGFNGGNGGQFLLNIDFNEVDNNLDLNQFGTPSNVPLPPAVWMFGSALIGLVSFPRRRGDRA